MNIEVFCHWCHQMLYVFNDFDLSIGPLRRKLTDKSSDILCIISI